LSQSASITATVAPITVNRQGQVPSVALGFRLPPKVSIGEAQRQSGRQRKSSTCRPRLIAVHIILGNALREYDPSDHDHSPPCPRRGLGALLTLMLFGMPLDVVGIVK
jgi:multidrug efflux pump subunit AcrB